jgi:quinol monooxygenase YgiN
MIVIAGMIRIDPAKRDAGIAAALDMMEETRKEDGCISYTFSADLADPGSFRIFEEWQSAEALAAHMASPHMARFQSLIPNLGVRDVKIQRYEVSSVQPM